MGKLFRNKSIVTIVSLAVCLVILFFAYRYRVNSAIGAVDIPIAAKRLEAREQITEDAIRTVKVAASMITQDVIRNQEEIKEKYVNYNTIIPEGSMFYRSAVVTADYMPDSAWANIGDNNTIVSLTVNAAKTYGNSIYPGNKIDLYFEGNRTVGDKNEKIIGKLIEGIEVLAVKDQSGKHIFKKSADQTEAAALIFSVPEDYHLLIREALRVGDLVPVPRNATYNKETNVASNFIRDFISNQFLTVDSDFVSEVQTNENINITE